MPYAGKEVGSHISLSVATAIESDTKDSRTYQSCAVYAAPACKRICSHEKGLVALSCPSVCPCVLMYQCTFL
jgi:hypothetical protein